MKKQFTVIPLLITFLMIPSWVFSETKTEDLSKKMGVIKSIELESRTCVVEVPIGGRSYTVGAVLSPDSNLKIGKTIAKLEDFRTGDTVNIEWRKIATGHIIESIEAINQSPLRSPEIDIPTHMAISDAILMGSLKSHIIQKKETLLDIARLYNLGFNEIQDLYPNLDPWIPPEGTELIIPSQRILPGTIKDGIIVNIAEFRMYYFLKGSDTIMTFPVGLGDKEWTTPVGKFRIGGKRVHPTWYIPSSLQYKYPVKAIPPGPDNPLGDYWMGLEGTDYGIHGTDIPWSIGRLVTHGCIRMYPEDIIQLFNLVKPGTDVSIIYEPVKIGVISGRVYVEVHRDIYARIADLKEYGDFLIEERGLHDIVDMEKFRQALELQDGLPRDVTL